MKYYIKDFDGTPDDAYELKNASGLYRDTAEDCAEDYWNRHGGWEVGWPVTFTLIADDGTERDYVVDMEHIPSFSAIEVRP